MNKLEVISTWMVHNKKHIEYNHKTHLEWICFIDTGGASYYFYDNTLEEKSFSDRNIYAVSREPQSIFGSYFSVKTYPNIDEVLVEDNDLLFKSEGAVIKRFKGL